MAHSIVQSVQQLHILSPSYNSASYGHGCNASAGFIPQFSHLSFISYHLLFIDMGNHHIHSQFLKLYQLLLYNLDVPYSETEPPHTFYLSSHSSVYFCSFLITSLFSQVRVSDYLLTWAHTTTTHVYIYFSI